MVFKCCIYGCNGNFAGGVKVSIFKFPRDPELVKIWESKTLKKNFKATISSRVCELHFRKEDVLRHIEGFDEKSGRLLRAKLGHPRLKDGAIPMIFSTEWECQKREEESKSLDCESITETGSVRISEGGPGSSQLCATSSGTFGSRKEQSSAARPLDPAVDAGALVKEPAALGVEPEIRSKHEDRFDMFGKVVAMKLRGLELHQRRFAEKFINDVLFEAEGGNLDGSFAFVRQTAANSHCAVSSSSGVHSNDLSAKQSSCQVNDSPEQHPARELYPSEWQPKDKKLFSTFLSSCNEFS